MNTLQEVKLSEVEYSNSRMSSRIIDRPGHCDCGGEGCWEANQKIELPLIRTKLS